MKTSFMNTEKTRTNRSHRFWLALGDKLNLKNRNKNKALVNLRKYQICIQEQ